ncbi:MAG: hypothetical protein IJ571_01790 [Ruminococcus sp.]|nr:hypothetical protein [Ruminococcus sp.]
MTVTVLSLVIGSELVMGFISGRVLIPYLRKLKTGRYDPYIGDRFAQDGSEPRLGGALILVCMLVGTLTGTAWFASRNDISGRADIRLIITVFTACGIMCALGAYEDILRDKGANVGLKPSYKHILRFAVILGALVLFRLFGLRESAVLLPFHWGYLELGILYMPVTALAGTVFLSAVTVCDCPAGKTELGVDGLCPTLLMIMLMSITAGLTVTDIHPEAQLVACVGMGAAGGYLFWGLCPSKIFFGESGALTLGTAVILGCVLARTELLLLIGAGAVLIDAFCALLQYVVFRARKKLLFKGYTLHEHLEKIGFGKYKIIGLGAAAQALFAAAVIMFIVYSGKFL